MAVSEKKYQGLFEEAQADAIRFRQERDALAGQIRVIGRLSEDTRIVELCRDAIAGKPLPDEGIDLIAAERWRQIEKEGWTPEHDDEHRAGELIQAALSYSAHALDQVRLKVDRIVAIPGMWPWNRAWWKPSADPIRELTKAGALIAAEIDRLRRAAITPTEVKHG